MQWGQSPDGLRQGNALQVSFRPGVPLQSTLFQMCQGAAGMFQQQAYTGDLQVGVTIGVDPCMHGFGDQVDLNGVESTSRAVIVLIRCIVDLRSIPVIRPKSCTRSSRTIFQWAVKNRWFTQSR